MITKNYLQLFANKKTLLLINIIALALLPKLAFAVLTLEQALQQASRSFAIEKQTLIIKQAQLALERNRNEYQLNLSTQLGTREEYNKRLDDSHLYLNLNKILFDSNQDADDLLLKTDIILERNRLATLKRLQRFAVIQVFFDVLLADLEYNYLTEALALSAVKRNHAEEDFAFGYISEITLSEKMTKVQLDAANRLQTQHKQILNRDKLATLLNIPYPERPDELHYPNLEKYLNYQVKHENIWHQFVNRHNDDLVNLKAEIKALKKKKQTYEQSWQWQLSGYLRLGEQTYNQDKEGNYRAGFNLNIPFGNVDHKQEIAAITLHIAQKKTELAEQQESLNSEVLRLFLTLKALKRKHKALKTQQEYLQFNLDKASLEYEMRLSRNIGNAMALVSENDLSLTKTAFAIATTIEQFNLLTQGQAL